MDDNRCGLCGACEETRDHLFGSCPVVLPLLKTMFQVMNIHHVPSMFSDYIHLFHSSTRKTASLFSIRAATFCAILDKIWSIRNVVVFRHEQVDIGQACHQLSQSLILRFSQHKSKSSRYFRQIVSKLQMI